MKKKLFAFALACIAFGSGPSSRSAAAGLIDLSTLPSMSRQVLDGSLIRDFENFNVWIDHGIDAVDKVCGDYNQLLTLLESSRARIEQLKAQSDDTTGAPNDPIVSKQTYVAQRPPVLKRPQLHLLPRNPMLDSKVASWINLAEQAREEKWIERAKTQLASIGSTFTKLVFDWKQVVSLSASKFAANYIHADNEVAGMLPAVDPVRARSLLEEYQAYDFTFQDRLWINRLHHQHRKLNPTSEDIEILDNFVAASDAACSPLTTAECIESSGSEVHVAGKVASSSKAYFVRKIPIDYEFESLPVENSQLESVGTSRANITEVPSLATVGDFQAYFGKNIIPVVDFESNLQSWSRFKIHIEPSQFAMAPALSVDKPQLAANKLLANKLESSYRKYASKAVRGLKQSLGYVQQWLDSVEVALSNEDSSAKVASKNVVGEQRD